MVGLGGGQLGSSLVPLMLFSGEDPEGGDCENSSEPGATAPVAALTSRRNPFIATLRVQREAKRVSGASDVFIDGTEVQFSYKLKLVSYTHELRTQNTGYVD